MKWSPIWGVSCSARFISSRPMETLLPQMPVAHDTYSSVSSADHALHETLGNLRVRLDLGLDPLTTHCDQLINILLECLWVGVAEVTRNVRQHL